MIPVVHITLSDIVGLTVFGIFALLFGLLMLFLGFDNLIIRIKHWRKTGCWTHEWKLTSTFGSGSKAEYHCTRCNKRDVH